MARLVGVDLPRDKRMAVALTYIYGVGRTRAADALAATGIDPNMRAGDLSDEQLVALRSPARMFGSMPVAASASAARVRPTP